ncbi:MAG: F0F1 ATP synthase subunit delta [Sphingomonadales bacterium CG12_big_fil_rev_8_21_14_0_65_65_10]|uniref:F0F1 ATP synthase subunit delta n=1 Tax=Blastomonas marina TaxID=1867408 RepID=UPI000CB939AA|nr:F0F1 ATP synthase subunit delta [Blastomonas marina]PIW56308.1 MAG: F0F1 ATP synthase subunit delta [Sphingomonadales bacterium CG12_big_fil_rev_8_21_14_0_65_65_10]WPZ05179.1 F0F1 ATP synthase subunit delta [Blastomonas marina]
MEISAALKASLAGRYASALFDLASEAGTVTAVETDLEKIEAALDQSPEFASLTTSPKVSRREAEVALRNIAPLLGISELTQSFLGTLAENRRLSKLPEMIRAFRAIAAGQRGEVSAEVTSAHALTDAQVAELQKKLTAREGRTVKLDTRIDPDLLGGLVVTIGSKRIDGSIRTRLNSLAQAMKG